MELFSQSAYRSFRVNVLHDNRSFQRFAVQFAFLNILNLNLSRFLLLKLTLILPTWRIWWAPNNASRWQLGFNLAFKWL